MPFNINRFMSLNFIEIIEFLLPTQCDVIVLLLIQCDVIVLLLIQCDVIVLLPNQCDVIVLLSVMKLFL